MRDLQNVEGPKIPLDGGIRDKHDRSGRSLEHRHRGPFIRPQLCGSRGDRPRPHLDTLIERTERFSPKLTLASCAGTKFSSGGTSHSSRRFQNPCRPFHGIQFRLQRPSRSIVKAMALPWPNLHDAISGKRRSWRWTARSTRAPRLGSVSMKPSTFGKPRELSPASSSELRSGIGVHGPSF